MVGLDGDFHPMESPTVKKHETNKSKSYIIPWILTNGSPENQLKVRASPNSLEILHFPWWTNLPEIKGMIRLAPCFGTHEVHLA